MAICHDYFLLKVSGHMDPAQTPNDDAGIASAVAGVFIAFAQLAVYNQTE